MENCVKYSVNHSYYNHGWSLFNVTTVMTIIRFLPLNWQNVLMAKQTRGEGRRWCSSTRLKTFNSIIAEEKALRLSFSRMHARSHHLANSNQQSGTLCRVRTCPAIPQFECFLMHIEYAHETAPMSIAP